MTANSKAVLFLALIGASLITTFGLYRGWTRTASDFPSYYTAAVLLKKREKLSRFYEMPYFQQQMDLLGMENQLGGYIPQTPVTMLPFVPLASLPVQTAKRVWLLAAVVSLAASVWLVLKITGLSAASLLGLVVLGAGSLYMNLLLGQYYLFLLFLLTAGVFCLETKREAAGGILFGVVCGFKLVTAPFFLYFAARRQWRALAGMGAAVALLAIFAIATFDWSGVAFYATHILPRSIAGETLDPFNPGTGTFTTLLRRSFVPEAELNPTPVLNAPWLFFFLRPLLTLATVWISLLAFSRTGSESISIAGLLVSVLLISPNTGSYTFVLLLLPIALLIRQASRRQTIFLAGCYLLLALPMRPAWSWLFPKVWLLAALFAGAVVCYGARVRARALGLGLAGATFASVLVATINLHAYQSGANRRWDPIAAERGAIYSSAPVSFPDGLVYESIRNGRYSLASLRGKQVNTISLAGDAFAPAPVYGTELVRFDLVSTGKVLPMLFEFGTGAVRSDLRPHAAEREEAALSPDGKWLAFSQNSEGSTQVYICAPDGQPSIKITDGNCNSFTPRWEWDSSALLFASDCGRGVGLPALYRAPLARVLALRNGG